MDMHVIHYFLAAAREGNITKAAKRLHMTQPTLSRQLAELESELGVRLFERSSRRITLTSEGILFRRRAEEMEGFWPRRRRKFLRERNWQGRSPSEAASSL